MSGPDHSRTYQSGVAARESGRARRPVWTELACVVTGGALLAFLGPFGTYDLPGPLRLAYWLVPTLAAYFLVRPLLATGGRLALKAGFDPKAGEVAALLLGAGTIAASLLAGGSILPSSVVGGETFGLLFIQVGVIALALYAGFLIPAFGAPLARVDSVSTAGEDRSPGAAFFDRLPVSFGREILCLKMEDHYLRAYNERGSVLLLMTMREAVEEVAELEGARVGRSWWVAREAIAAVERRGRAFALTLGNGLHVPVPRGCAAALREKGWL